MLPARLNGQVQVTPFDSLESFTGGSHQVAFENAAGPGREARGDRGPGRQGDRLDALDAAGRPGAYGFGRVTVIGLDVDSKPFSDWPDRALFFVKALDLKGVERRGRTPSRRSGGSSTRTSPTSPRSVRRSLDQFQGVTLIPFGWVAGFIFLYILLIGPGDYFFLKKVLKRMELTWITFPTIVVTVSLLAYYAAYVVKGTDLRVNKIDVVDIDLRLEDRPGGRAGSTCSARRTAITRSSVVPISPDREPPADPKAAVRPRRGPRSS